MINRRILRIKAFQQLYAYLIKENALETLSFDKLNTYFLPDLSLMEPKESQIEKLDPLKKQAQELLKAYFSGENPSGGNEKLVNTAYLESKKYFESERLEIIKKGKKDLLEDIDNIYKFYLKALFLLEKITNLGIWDENRRLLESSVKTSKFKENKLLEVFKNWKELHQIFEEYQIGLSEEEEVILRNIFVKEIVKDENIIEYLSTAGENLEKDIKIVDYIFRKYIMSSEKMTTYFEEKDLNWNINREIIKNLGIKTFKISNLEDLEIQKIGVQWEEDKEFFLELYEKAIEEKEENQKEISQYLKNWDLERLALIDSIIIETALTEMVNFPSIPVKVTMNEYIEMTKKYSTPKSSNFVNGILDSISNKWIAERKIRKSARGMV
ncbi:MAG: hypothetical protein RIR51_109 [Bacteroidota bacterium]|jgi:N utilization substance protein B